MTKMQTSPSVTLLGKAPRLEQDWGCLCAVWLGGFACQSTPLTHFPEHHTHTVVLPSAAIQRDVPWNPALPAQHHPSTCTAKGNFKTFPSDRALPSGDTFWAQSTEGLQSFWTSVIKENQLLKAFRKHFHQKILKQQRLLTSLAGLELTEKQKPWIVKTAQIHHSNQTELAQSSGFSRAGRQHSCFHKTNVRGKKCSLTMNKQYHDRL